MNRSKTRYLIMSLLIISLFAPGCILSPKGDPPTPPPPDTEYGDLTSKDHVITNLGKSYNEANIDEYIKIIHNDYLWYNQAEDVLGGAEEFVLRDEDVLATSNMFAAKNGNHPDPNMLIDKLTLTLYPGSWTQITEIEGTPCEDCWTTTREYFMTVVMSGVDMTYNANDLVKLWVVPVMEGDKKLYKLRRMDDIKK